ncbi:hypothetical protein LOC68_06090 [Blastopirellula sp. JC732]|uniref:Uncharacterized protein n=1 Tax=Blastopirellula sediminis TaxID=2894196 RepID=A0A9X1SF64_9BACT|nr:hypothetical protein [Blastopirellula sediminis]MCC9609265.1 hypothetical protein [Blastopirellula sediminis]MCC9627958.1 hypothetical protein [Blastopirellula sediminis]
MQNLLPVLTLALVGCGGSSPPPIPPTTGDFVANQEGVGTAQAFGIDFHVQANSSGASAEGEIDADLINTENSTARKRFSLGDDVTIQLDSVDASTVRFLLNDQDFGVLRVGDQVVIDAEKNVTVNGTARTPM